VANIAEYVIVNHEIVDQTFEQRTSFNQDRASAIPGIATEICRAPATNVKGQ
jgi:hypothetical protein